MRVIHYEDKVITCEMTKQELITSRNALREVCFGSHAIEEWEFALLMGVKRERAIEILQEVDSLIAGLNIAE
jgi:hypothetical protein